MAALLVSHHRPGFYFRVLEEGEVGSEDEIVKIGEDPGRMTVAEADALLYPRTFPRSTATRIEHRRLKSGLEVFLHRHASTGR